MPMPSMSMLRTIRPSSWRHLSVTVICLFTISAAVQAEPASKKSNPNRPASKVASPTRANFLFADFILSQAMGMEEDFAIQKSTNKTFAYGEVLLDYAALTPIEADLLFNIMATGRLALNDGKEIDLHGVSWEISNLKETHRIFYDDFEVFHDTEKGTVLFRRKNVTPIQEYLNKQADFARSEEAKSSESKKCKKFLKH